MKAFSFFLWLSVLLSGFSGLAEEFTCTAIAPDFRARSVPAPIVGNKHVLWYRLSFANDSRAPASATQAEAAMQDANATLQRISYGKVSATWSVTPLLQLPRDSVYYSTDLIALLRDARNAAATNGFNYLDYDLDLLAPPGIAGWMQGYAAIGGRWMYVSVPNAGLVVHEMGHTFGLPHANSWDTARPSPTTKTSPPFPSNISQITDNYTFQTNAFIGRFGIMFRGNSVEYGDPTDIMASSSASADYNVNFKTRIGWIAPTQVTNVTTSGLYRIYTKAAASLRTDRAYALKIDRAIVGRFSDNLVRNYWIEPNAVVNSAVIRWADVANTQSTLLINAQSGYFPRATNPALPIGRAFDDPRFRLSLTTIAAGGSGDDRWIDVAVEMNSGSKEVANPILQPDLPGQYQITGRVVDDAGNPIAGARVHTGRINAFPGDRGDLITTLTDANGDYTLWVDYIAAPFPIGVSAYGYRSENDEQSIVVSPSGAATANFSLTPLPHVSVAAAPQTLTAVNPSFTVSRTGSTSAALDVYWQATSDSSVIANGVATIPAGATSALVSTAAGAAGQTVSFHVIDVPQFTRDSVTYCYPGWELRGAGADAKWFQTDPTYATFADASASTTFVSSLAPTLTISIGSLQIRGTPNQSVRIESSSNLTTWQTLTTITLTNGSASVALPQSSTAIFFRAVGQ